MLLLALVVVVVVVGAGSGAGAAPTCLRRSFLENPVWLGVSRKSWSVKHIKGIW